MQKIQSGENAATRQVTLAVNLLLILQKLLSCYLSKGGVQARMPSIPVVGWTNTDLRGI